MVYSSGESTMPRFQQRHYRRIAEVISEISETELNARRKQIVIAALATMFESDNYKFKPHLFLKACGITEQQS